MDRRDARFFLAAAPALTDGLRAASRGTGLSWPALLALHMLNLNDGVSVDALAARMGRNASTLSPVLRQLREDGYLRQTWCAEFPERCTAAPKRRPCGQHRLQWLEEKGRAAAEEWAEPFVDLLTTTNPRMWLKVASVLRLAKGARPLQPGRARSRPPRRAA